MAKKSTPFGSPRFLKTAQRCAADGGKRPKFDKISLIDWGVGCRHADQSGHRTQAVIWLHDTKKCTPGPRIRLGEPESNVDAAVVAAQSLTKWHAADQQDGGADAWSRSSGPANRGRATRWL